jgi:ABC-type sugar transport system, periplasmic component
MRKTIKKLLSMGLVMTMAATMVTGCGSSAKSDTASTPAATKAASTASSAAGEKVTLEFFNQKTEIVDILNNLIKEYEKENPNVTIKLTTVANASQVLATRMSSGDIPDIFTQWPNSAFFTQVDSGYVMDLSKTGIMDNVQDAARNQWKHNGGEYAATISYNCSGIWYNKDMFDKAGIKTLPTTWDELIKDCDTLKAAGFTPFVTSAKEATITDRQLQVFLASSLKNYDDFEKDAGAATVDTKKAYGPELTQMGEKMVQIIKYSQKDILGTDQDSATANFAKGDGAMMIGGSWLLASISAANPKINISMMPIPGDTADETNTCAYPGDMSLCISKTSKNADAAVAFVKWMTSVDTATNYAKAEGNPSCIKDVNYVADQFKDLYANYVTSGKFILNPDCNWTAAQQNAAGAAIQQLYYKQDTKAFADGLASAFNDN